MTFQRMTFDYSFAEASWLALSTELLQSILSYLGPKDLINVDLTCKRLYTITEPVYHILYGPDTYLHCKVDNSPNWKALVLDEEHLKESMKDTVESLTPDKVIDNLLSESYHSENAYLAEISEIFIVGLRNCTEQWTPSWLEAMATALMAQGRLDDAKRAYQMYLRNDRLLPERTFLTAAHFGWPKTFPPLPDDISQTTMEMAIFGAAAGCNQEMVTRLHRDGVSLDQHDGSQTLAIVAAASGNLPLLKFLCERGTDVLEVGNEPLRIATHNNQVEVVNFLLSLGGRSDIVGSGRAPLEIAVIKGNIQLLRMFFKHTPSLVSAEIAGGKPVMFALTDTPNSMPTNTMETLEYLVKEAGVDIYAVDDKGNTLAHQAALHGDLKFTKLLRDFNMDLSVENILGHTPQDLASAAGYTELAIWLAGHNGTVYEPQRARVNAATVITSRHSRLIERLASEPTVPGDTVEEKIAGVEVAWDADRMDDKFVTVYLSWFSPRTLQFWNDILGGEADKLMLKLWDIFSMALRAGAESIILKDDEESRLPVACSIVDRLVPYSRMKPELQKAIVRNMALADLQTLSDFFDEEPGGKIAAGEMARVSDTALILHNFGTRWRFQ
jgi:hypothetical protein